LEALNVYQQALKIQESIDDRGGKGNVLHNIGGGYDRLGWDAKVAAYHQQALQFYQQSLAITAEIGKS
jgi:tetratricopeptide (TPR) repeat protein